MRRAPLLAVTALLALLASPASADVPPDDPACAGKAVGAECPGGACERSTCTRSRPDPAGGPAVTSTVPCMQCAKGAKATSEKKAGCALEAGGPPSSAGVALLGLGALAALVARRGRRP